MRPGSRVALAVALLCLLPGVALAGGMAERLLKEGDGLSARPSEAGHGLAKATQGGGPSRKATDDQHNALHTGVGCQDLQGIGQTLDAGWGRWPR